MATQTLHSRGQTHERLAEKINLHVSSGDDAVVIVGKDPDPERILRIIAATIGPADVQLVVQHAELKEYLELALAGVAIGSAVGASAFIINTLALGNPITIGPALLSILIGGIVGLVVGVGLAAVAEIRVYRRNGVTRMKFLPQVS